MRTLRRLSTIVLLGVLLPAGSAGEDSMEFPYYFSDGDRIPLTPAPRHLAVRFAPGFQPDLGALVPTIVAVRQRELPLNRLTLFDLPQETSLEDRAEWISTLAGLPEIELVARVFQTPDALMIVADQFIAAFPPETTRSEIEQLGDSQEVEVVRRLVGEENVWLLRVPGTDALETANRFHRLPNVLYAHPDFVRVVERRPLPGLAPDEVLILGPDGERLPPDTRIEKGSEGYRGRRPGALTLPEAPRSESPPGTQAPVARATIVSEGFEGVFPNPSWMLLGSPTWDDASYRSYSGSWSGYCVDSMVPPPGPYPNDVVAWMIHGPFSLVGAQDARVDLQAWINTEADYDFFGIYASVDGSMFYGESWSGNWASASGGSGWMNIAFDLKRVFTLGDLRGASQVWIALIFSSDYSVTYEGAYVDDVVVEKITGGYGNLTSDVHDHLQWSLENNEQLWGIDDADIDAAAAWGVTHGSNTITVAVIDEGVDLTHPDLAGKLVTGFDATGGGSGGGAVGDEAHGTNCAGIAAATTANGMGVAGIAREAKLMSVRIFAGGVTTDAWAADGINWAWMNDADVLSNSWGGGSPVTIITNAIAAAKTSGRGGKGSVVLFASGNDNGPVAYPAILSTVQAIGALSPCDQRKAPTSCDGEHWWGSNYGPELDLTAPGVHMYSTDIQGAAGYDSGDYFYNFNGTSSATPVAAGVAALMLGYNPSLTATQVETALAATADDLNAPGWDSETGYGRINAYEAVQAIVSEEFDWGDAPDPTYPTLAASNGARHLLGSPLLLGASVDPDPDGQPTSSANGDDLDGNDDEDGVTLAPRLEKWTSSPVTVVATAPGVLNAWVDFNIDGDWLDAGEQIFVDQPLVPGANALAFLVPGSATTGTSFARFRFSSLGGLQPTGLAPDGEVEDYQVSLGPPMDLVLANIMINSAATYEACNSITAGPACVLQSAATVTLRMGGQGIFVNGFSTQNGARLIVDNTNPAGCP